MEEMISLTEIEFKDGFDGTITITTFVIPWWVVGSVLTLCFTAAGVAVVLWRKHKSR